MRVATVAASEQA